MTSSYSNESRDVSLLILDPSLIVLPIPDQEVNATTPVMIYLRINNPKSQTFPFIEGFLRPELHGRDGQALPLQKFSDNQTGNNPYRGLSVPSQSSFGRPLMTELGWQDGSLQLQMDIPGGDSPDYFHRWVFPQLQSGTYRLRFTYTNPLGEFSFSNVYGRKSTTVEVFQGEVLTTAWVTLQLIETLGNAIEVDGICFETLVPESIVTSPQDGEENCVQFGVRISNRTSIPYRFELPLFLPEFLALDRRWIQVGINRNKVFTAQDLDIPLIEPGENVNFLMEAKLVWSNRKEGTSVLELGGEAVYGGTWGTEVSRGHYQVRFTYKNQLSKKELLLSSTGRTKISPFWIGKIVTPFVGLFFQ